MILGKVSDVSRDALHYVRDFPGQVKSTILITLILIIVSLIIGHKFKKVDPTQKTPLWLVPIIFVVDLINSFVKTNIGKRWKSYAPYFLTLAIFLLCANLCGIFAMDNPSSYIVLNFGLGLITFFIVQITGIVSLGLKGYLGGFVGPVKPLAIIMIPINIVGEITLPVSLSLRLLGNIVSGCVLGMMIKGLLGWGAIPILPIFNGIFDIAFGIIQCFVFTVLSIIFTSQKIDDDEKIFN